MIKIAVSSGDPAGIGPDICIKAFGQKKPYDFFPVIFGDMEMLRSRAENLGINVDIKIYEGKEKLSNDSLWIAKEFEAIVTCPINKEVINKGGIKFTGHTEELAKLSDTDSVVMLLVNEKLKVALATTHLPLKEVPSKITKDLIHETLLIIDKDLKNKWKIKNPSIKVLGLNPHAGDGGFIGLEDQEILIPVIENLNSLGLNITGPLSADTAFIDKDNQTKEDVILAMYHDQGLPVIKTLGFGSIVNVTLGLPFVRTSVDHGTAYDAAGSIEANESSLVEAAKLAATIAKS